MRLLSFWISFPRYYSYYWLSHLPKGCFDLTALIWVSFEFTRKWKISKIIQANPTVIWRYQNLKKWQNYLGCKNIRFAVLKKQKNHILFRYQITTLSSPGIGSMPVTFLPCEFLPLELLTCIIVWYLSVSVR